MSLKGKNRAIYSYNNEQRVESNFMYKDFEKSHSYRSNFQNAKFDYASLRAAHMKFCNFDGASFKETEFVGTNLRGSTFRGARFQGAIFRATILENANFKDAEFIDCYFVGMGVSNAKNFPSDCNGITFLNTMPNVADFSEELINVVQELRMNDIIRRSNTLHLKQGKVNTLSLMILRKTYSEEELIQLLPMITSLIEVQFYTLSYLKMLLKKVSQTAILK